MCGIALTNNNSFLDVEELSYRGVDSYSTIIENGFYFHFFRLAFIGKDDKFQQILSNDRYIVLYNGEIYNYKELAHAHSLPLPESDGEILLFLLEKGANPKEIFQQLTGMFAIIIYDKLIDSVFVTRDFYGQKPMWLVTDNNNWLFTSELKTCKSLILDESALFDYVHVPLDNFNLFSNAVLLDPGFYYEYSLNRQKLELIEYVKLSFESSLLKKEDVNTILLEDSFEGVVNTDFGKVGILLSGGVDSTLVAGILSKSVKLNAISFNTQDNMFESKEVVNTSNFLNIPYEIVEMDGLSIDDVNAALDIYFIPTWDSSVPLTYRLLKEVSGKYKVIITGDGGDELYHGYVRHRLFNLRMQMPWFFKIYFGNNRFLSILFGPDNNSILNTYIPFYTYLRHGICRQLVKDKYLEDTYEGAIEKIDRRIILQNLLRRVDLMGLRHNIEVRSPLLNLKIKFDFGFSLKLLFNNKPILRRILKDLKLDKLVLKTKKGFEFNYPRIFNELLILVSTDSEMIEKFKLNHIDFNKLDMSDKYQRNLILHLYSSFRFYKSFGVRNEK